MDKAIMAPELSSSMDLSYYNIARSICTCPFMPPHLQLSSVNIYYRFIFNNKTIDRFAILVKNNLMQYKFIQYY